MQKIKNYRSADCVVGGFRYATGKKLVGSLLLGLYDKDGLLHHVGFTSAIKAAERPALTKKVEALIAPPGFTGNAPGGPSRWSTARSEEWQPLKPKLVVEVSYDHFTGGRFRHGTSILRWRPDKAPQPMHDRSGQAEARQPDEAAGLTQLLPHCCGQALPLPPAAKREGRGGGHLLAGPLSTPLPIAHAIDPPPCRGRVNHAPLSHEGRPVIKAQPSSHCGARIIP